MALAQADLSGYVVVALLAWARGKLRQCHLMGHPVKHILIWLFWMPYFPHPPQHPRLWQGRSLRAGSPWIRNNGRVVHDGGEVIANSKICHNLWPNTVAVDGCRSLASCIQTATPVHEPYIKELMAGWLLINGSFLLCQARYVFGAPGRPPIVVSHANLAQEQKNLPSSILK